MRSSVWIAHVISRIPDKLNPLGQAVVSEHSADEVNRVLECPAFVTGTRGHRRAGPKTPRWKSNNFPMEYQKILMGVTYKLERW